MKALQNYRYVGSIFALHLVKKAPAVQSDAPSAVRLVAELVLGIWAYDFIFYWRLRLPEALYFAFYRLK